MMHGDISQTGIRLFIFLLLAAGLIIFTVSPPLHASPASQLFDAPLSHYLRGDPKALALGDFNGDGHLDAALAQDTGWFTGGYMDAAPGQRGSGLTIGLGDGTGQFSMQNSISIGYEQTGVAVGDLNGDDVLDLMVSFYNDYESYSYYYSGGVALVMGNGDGTFAAPVYPLDGDYLPRDLVLGDLNGDDRLDLAVVLVSDNSVAIMLGHGNGAFSAPVHLATGYYPRALALDDLDGDGDTDLAVINSYDDSISVMLNNGDGTFPAAVAYPAGGSPSAITVADLDQAGGLDVVVTNYYSGTLSVLFGSGSGAFSAPVSYAAGNKPGSVAAGDIDGDGHLDLAVGSDSNSILQLMINDGSGGFAPGITRQAPHYTADLAIVDLDGDGDQDLCLATTGVSYCTGSYVHWYYYGDYFGRLSVLLNYGGGVFLDPGSQAVGSGPISLALGDLSEDGIPDLVAVDGSRLWVLPGSGDAGFGAPTGYEAIGGLDVVVLGDLNGDSHLDSAVVSSTATSIFLGSGDGTLVLAGSIDIGGDALHAADLDLDGDLDLVVILGSVHILLGNGDGTFEDIGFTGAAEWYRQGQSAVGELNGDGVPDLAIRYVWDDGYYVDYSAVDVWLGVGDGTFTPGETYQLGSYHGSLQLSDLDLDGRTDLLWAQREMFVYDSIGFGIRVNVRWGRGDGTFPTSSSFVTGVKPSAMHVDDLNGDGLPDLAVTNAKSRNVAVVINVGDRVFESGISYCCGNQPRCLAAADLDGDGDLELVTGNLSSNDVSILLNSSFFPFLVTGPGRGERNPPLVRLFDLSQDHVIRRQWQAYGVSRYGVNVAGADLDGDGRHEMLTGAGPGAVFGPHVRGWAWDGSTTTPIPGLSYFAYGTPKWGVNVAGGDIDGDGIDEIITGAGPGSVYGPHVRGWNWDGSGTVAPIGQVSFLAYGTNRWGVNVSAGDIDGDGIDEIVTGAGPSLWFSPNVRGWNWDGAGPVTMIPGLDFFAYNTGRWGVNVSCGDLDGDGIDEIVTGQGPGSALDAYVRGWNFDGETVAPMPGVDFIAYDPAMVLHGVKVAAGRAWGIPGR